MPHSPTMLAVFFFHAVLIGIVLLPAAAITTVLALAIRTSRVMNATREKSYSSATINIALTACARLLPASSRLDAMLRRHCATCT